MTTGYTSYTDVSSLLNTIYDKSLKALREENLLVPTVTVYRDTKGLVPRKVNEYGTLTVNTITESDDMTPQTFNPSALSTLTPLIYGVQGFITDMRIASEQYDSIVDDMSDEMRAGFSEKIDQTIAGRFSSLTGGTVGSAGGTLSWSNILKARALLQQAEARGPFYCVLGAGQWYHLVNTALNSANVIDNAPAFRDRLINNYFVTPLVGGVTFIVTNNVTGTGGTAAYGAMYSPRAIAYDERRGFMITPERDESRGGGGWELNATLVAAVGTWRPVTGVQLIGTDVPA